MPLSTTHIEDAFTSKEEDIKKLLSCILNLNLHEEANERCIINIINKLLSTAKNRKEGLEYLNLIIGNCSCAVIREHALTWTSHCIIKFPNDVLRELKLRLIGEIIKASHRESDFNKKFVTEYVSKVLENCLTTSHVSPFECRSALKTLTIAMRHYPSWFGMHKQKIEAYILIFLDSHEETLVQEAALAFHYLQQIGGAGSNGVNHKQNFSLNLQKLCRTAHSLQIKLFENEVQLFTNSEQIEGDIFEFPKEPNGYTSSTLGATAKRICSVFKFIETMIKTSFPVAKETKPKLLLDMVCQFLEYHKCISGTTAESLESYQFSLLLQEIQSFALKLLRLLILWYQSDVLPFSYTISKSIIECIERANSCDCYKSDSLYQEEAFEALNQWVAVCKSSLHPQFQSRLLEAILVVITPEKPEVMLTISGSNLVGKKSDKAKRRAMTSRIISSESNRSANHDSLSDHNKSNVATTCKLALLALKGLLECTKLNIKPTFLKSLYKSVFGSLINIQLGNVQFPYNEPQNQATLYEVLVAIYCQNSLPVLPPLHTALDILNRGANDRNRFIAVACQEGLRVLESFCQPICPSLYMGAEKDGAEVDDVEDASQLPAERSEEQGSVISSTASVGSDTMIYHVRYTESDRSTIDDGLSEKGTRNEEFSFEEVCEGGKVDIEAEDSSFKLFEDPVVTAPSEDGREVLEGEYHDVVMESIFEEETETESNANTDSEQKDDGSEKCIPQDPSKKPEDTGEDEAISMKAQNVDNTTDAAESVSSTTDKECEEPLQKKAKVSESSKVVSDSELKTEEKDLDESYLEDDSFADVVKDY